MLFPDIVELSRMIYPAGILDVEAPVDFSRIIHVTGVRPYSATSNQMTMDEKNLRLLGMHKVKARNCRAGYQVEFEQTLDHDRIIELLDWVGGFCEYSTDYILSEDGQSVQINNMSACLWNKDWAFQMPTIYIELYRIDN